VQFKILIFKNAVKCLIKLQFSQIPNEWLKFIYESFAKKKKTTSKRGNQTTLLKWSATPKG
jgi:hypothetical protein